LGGAVLYDPTGTYHLIQLKKAMIVGSNYLLTEMFGDMVFYYYFCGNKYITIAYEVID
jgi:hypothetical protein